MSVYFGMTSLYHTVESLQGINEGRLDGDENGGNDDESDRGENGSTSGGNRRGSVMHR